MEPGIDWLAPREREQWKDGRSAKESARAWLEHTPACVPSEITQALRAHRDFGRILPDWEAEPEARVPFDSFGGEPSNLDVLITAEAGELRYQLLTASAAALAEAQRRAACRAVLIIHEFVTGQTSDSSHLDNAKDLNAFVSRLSGTVTTLCEGTVQGPFELPGHPLTRFYIGKAVRNLRSSDE